MTVVWILAAVLTPLGLFAVLTVIGATAQRRRPVGRLASETVVDDMPSVGDLPEWSDA